MTDFTGYNPDEQGNDAPHSRIQRWRLVEHKKHYAPVVLARITADGEDRGLIRFHNKEEFEWMKELLDRSERRRTDREMNPEED